MDLWVSVSQSHVQLLSLFQYVFCECKTLWITDLLPSPELARKSAF